MRFRSNHSSDKIVKAIRVFWTKERHLLVTSPKLKLDWSMVLLKLVASVRLAYDRPHSPGSSGSRDTHIQ